MKFSRENIVCVFRTQSGVPGTVGEMVESWKVEQTCVTNQSQVTDLRTPCSGHEARKEWAEKECNMVMTNLSSIDILII